jgi:hypothetical protein
MVSNLEGYVGSYVGGLNCPSTSNNPRHRSFLSLNSSFKHQNFVVQTLSVYVSLSSSYSLCTKKRKKWCCSMFHEWRLRLSMARNLELLAFARRFGSFFLFVFCYSQFAIRSVAFHFRVFCLIFYIIFIVFELNICESDLCLLISFFICLFLFD